MSEEKITGEKIRNKKHETVTRYNFVKQLIKSNLKSQKGQNGCCGALILFAVVICIIFPPSTPIVVLILALLLSGS